MKSFDKHSAVFGAMGLGLSCFARLKEKRSGLESDWRCGSAFSVFEQGSLRRKSERMVWGPFILAVEEHRP